MHPTLKSFLITLLCIAAAALGCAIVLGLLLVFDYLIGQHGSAVFGGLIIFGILWGFIHVAVTNP